MTFDTPFIFIIRKITPSLNTPLLVYRTIPSILLSLRLVNKHNLSLYGYI